MCCNPAVQIASGDLVSDDDAGRNSRRAVGSAPLLVYLDPDLIIRLKKLALDRRTHAYLLAEDAVRGLVDASSSEAS